MRVLVIEDEPDLIQALVQSLREDGYAVDQAMNGCDGLLKAEACEYEAVVLDLMLPRHERDRRAAAVTPVAEDTRAHPHGPRRCERSSQGP